MVYAVDLVHEIGAPVGFYTGARAYTGPYRIIFIGRNRRCCSATAAFSRFSDSRRARSSSRSCALVLFAQFAVVLSVGVVGVVGVALADKLFFAASPSLPLSFFFCDLTCEIFRDR